MPDLAAADVTYTITSQRISRTRRTVEATVAFGDGALTYPSGGVPLTKGKLRMKRDLIALDITDPGNANGLTYKWDKTNNKLRVYKPTSFIITHNASAAATTVRTSLVAAKNKIEAVSPSVGNTDVKLAAEAIELIAATDAPAAATLKVIALGW